MGVPVWVVRNGLLEALGCLENHLILERETVYEEHPSKQVTARKFEQFLETKRVTAEPSWGNRIGRSKDGPCGGRGLWASIHIPVMLNNISWGFGELEGTFE